jgi:hypothetical protein
MSQHVCSRVNILKATSQRDLKGGSLHVTLVNSPPESYCMSRDLLLLVGLGALFAESMCGSGGVSSGKMGKG